tara:strand:- start:48 stop:587 length:540 start_codon:yes stop_codon:yes gene_type:complete
MKVNKFIKSKIERDYFFVTGKIKIDVDYFIQKIEEGINRKDNENFTTNLMSEMTSYKYFLHDETFHEMLLPFNQLVDDNNFNYDLPWQLDDAWGFKQSIGNYSKPHHHLPTAISGTIMLTKHPQTLYFPDIKQELKCEPGAFAFFSPFLLHSNKRTKSHVPRYGLSFNYINNYRTGYNK